MIKSVQLCLIIVHLNKLQYGQMTSVHFLLRSALQFWNRYTKVENFFLRVKGGGGT